MKRLDQLPADLRAWITQQPRQQLRAAMVSSVTRRASGAKLNLDSKRLADQIKQLDDRYFDLSQSDTKKEAVTFFRLARALSCLQNLNAGDEDEAVYEFMHSLDEITVDAARAETRNG